jgi:hypothetical protein
MTHAGPVISPEGSRGPGLAPGERLERRGHPDVRSACRQDTGRIFRSICGISDRIMTQPGPARRRGGSISTNSPPAAR